MDGGELSPPSGFRPTFTFGSPTGVNLSDDSPRAPTVGEVAELLDVSNRTDTNHLTDHHSGGYNP